ncbi:hypothetical protein BAU15_02755 [Enterococcus sp. JM4C]|uniref:hypothetical protein n=1 Tax=Candidatus Enterococcus huntleyi TaxID=1857217 RepID=UPI00137B79C6|nr:hypothetical protein [Enterococcus sp. JM4C]KAF1299581.1 hypothetical protein BAU15_02755 [Enterococcus sp. JM4C]
MRKESIREVIGFFIPVAVVILGSLFAIYTEDFTYLKMCTIGGYGFIPLFIWRLCANIYYDTLFKREENNAETENFEKDDESF